MRSTKLDHHTISEIERILKRKHAELKESLRHVVSKRGMNETPRPADFTVWATESLHEEIEVALIDRYSYQVAQIEAALERLAMREYGSCQDCGEFIGLARLRALPFAQRCTPCQSRAELQERQEPRPVPTFIAADDE